MRLDSAVDRWAPCCHVYLDGQLLTHCMVADEEAGWAEIVEWDAASPTVRQYVPDATCPRGYRTRMVWGKVELRFPGPRVPAVQSPAGGQR